MVSTLVNITMYRVVKSVCCTLETNVTLCINCTSIKKFGKPKKFNGSIISLPNKNIKQELLSLF